MSVSLASVVCAATDVAVRSRLPSVSFVVVCVALPLMGFLLNRLLVVGQKEKQRREERFAPGWLKRLPALFAHPDAFLANG